MDDPRTIATALFNTQLEPAGVSACARDEIVSNVEIQIAEHGGVAVTAWIMRGLNRAKDRKDPAAWLAATFKTAKCPPVEYDKPKRNLAAHRTYVQDAEEPHAEKIEMNIQDYLAEYRELGPAAYAEKHGLAGSVAGTGRARR